MSGRLMTGGLLTGLTLSGPMLAGLALAGSALTAEAQTAPKPKAEDRGFSYFMGVGRYSQTQREAPSVVPVRSKATADSPLLVTGALYAIDVDRLLSLDAETTFAPSSTTERWTATAATVGGTTLTSNLLQTNRFSVQQNNTRLLFQQRLSGPWFAAGGMSFHMHSFKRFGFAAGPDNAVNLPPGAVDETVSEVLLNAALVLESEHVRGSTRHYGLRVGLARPLWRRVQNTAFPDNDFNGTSGWNAAIAGRYSVAVHPNMHLGGWAQVMRSERSGQRQGNVELPRSRTVGLSYGAELLWKL